MRIGFVLPNIGPAGTSEGIVGAAQRAEALGYDSLWVTERLLYPLAPRTPYPATSDGSLPEVYKLALDPVETLTFVAAHTKRIALGTSVLDIPYYNPVLLARRLTTLDIFSDGRLRVGLGQGWSADEFEAAGASFSRRGARADEFLQVLKAIWTSEPVEFHGKFYHVPRSIIRPKPVQQPHPPIYLAAYAPASLKRVARFADGWNPAGLPLQVMAQMWKGVQEMARAEGRDPASLQLVVRANLLVTEVPEGRDRMIFTGTLDQIREDTRSCRELGAHEVFFDPTFSPGAESLDLFLSLMEKLRGMA